MSVYCKHHLNRFWHDQDGSPSVEFVIWLPIFILVLGLVVDVSVFMHAQSRMYDAVADGTRCWAVGACTQAEAETLARNSATFMGSTPTSNGATNGRQVSMTLAMNVSDVAVLGIISWAASSQMTATVTQITEGY